MDAEAMADAFAVSFKGRHLGVWLSAELLASLTPDKSDYRTCPVCALITH